MIVRILFLLVTLCHLLFDWSWSKNYSLVHPCDSTPSDLSYYWVNWHLFYLVLWNIHYLYIVKKSTYCIHGVWFPIRVNMYIRVLHSMGFLWTLCEECLCRSLFLKIFSITELYFNFTFIRYTRLVTDVLLHVYNTTYWTMKNTLQSAKLKKHKTV